MMTFCAHSKPHLQSELAIQEDLLLKGTLEMSGSCTVFMFIKHNCHAWARLPISCFLCFDLSCFALLKPSPGFRVWGFQATILWFSSEETTLLWWLQGMKKKLHKVWKYVFPIIPIFLFGGSLPHEKAGKTKLAFFC